MGCDYTPEYKNTAELDHDNLLDALKSGFRMVKQSDGFGGVVHLILETDPCVTICDRAVFDNWAFVPMSYVFCRTCVEQWHPDWRPATC